MIHATFGLIRWTRIVAELGRVELSRLDVTLVDLSCLLQHFNPSNSVLRPSFGPFFLALIITTVEKSISELFLLILWSNAHDACLPQLIFILEPFCKLWLLKPFAVLCCAHERMISRGRALIQGLRTSIGWIN
jgi:hypothetical protein